MKTFYANFWREMKYNLGRRGVWMGRLVNVSVSILTAFAMGIIYSFSSDAQSIVGIANVGLFLLTGFFLQYLVLSSVTIAPNTFWSDIRNGSFEFIFYYEFSISEYIFGIYFAQFIIDFVISLPFLIAIIIVAAINSIPVILIIAFIGFLIFSFLCLFSITMLFASLYVLSKQFMGYHGAVTYIAYFVCGVYFPILGYLSLFGQTAGWAIIGIISIFPYTQVFDIARYIIFGSSYTLAYPALWVAFLIMISSSIIFYFLSLIIFRKGFKNLRKEGFAAYRY
jgi:ABC-type polysaccharide/polyol phosphate export permease